MKNFFFWLVVAAVSVMLSSCATIVGGAKYNAKVLVPNHPNASINYNGVYKGAGEANFQIRRRDADKVFITVKDEGYEEYTHAFKERTFRGWPFAGSFFWTGYVISGQTTIIAPWGIVVDAITGAWWKPDVNEKGVTKEDYDHFIYTIPYDPKKLAEASAESPAEAPSATTPEQ